MSTASLSVEDTAPHTGRVEEAANTDRLFLYDGVCGFCHRSVRILVALDANQVFHYAPLQGETAAKMREKYPTIPDSVETLVYIEDGRAYLRSRAILQAARYYQLPWKIAYYFRWFPAPVLDLGYRALARVRYKIFGKVDSCQLPAPELRRRFLP